VKSLAEKYRRMAALRKSLSAAEPPDAAQRAELKQLAKDFPGALRELDTLPTDEIERRLSALEGGQIEPWMRWMQRYHELMRAALHIKAHPDRDTAQLAAQLAEESGVDEVFVRQVAKPQHGRLMVTVFEQLSQEEGLERGALWDALFPPRKGPREYRRK
jgi:hypothetical protein